MKSDIDYEQLYYDTLYENRKLKNKISELEIELQDLNICRTKRNIDLQKYIMLQIERRKDGKTSTKKKI
ncbi:unknown [Clostridium sp. CAG:470]|nr:unknown [Clostridium sp. CAG:470]